MHRSPDGFRARGSLIASLVALQTVLQAVLRATLAGAPSTASSSDGEHGAEPSPERTVSTSAAEPPLFEQLRVAVLAGTGSSKEATAATVAVGGADGSNAQRIGGGGGDGVSGRQRLGWVLRLACHRDAAVRALALGLLAEVVGLSSSFSTPAFSPSFATAVSRRALDSSALGKEKDGIPDSGSRSPELAEAGGGGGGGGDHEEEDEGEEEEVRSCVRAALDGDYESPAVVAEALRFLCR